MGPSRRLQLDLSRLEAFGQLAWVSFAVQIVCAAKVPMVVEVRSSGLCTKMFTRARRVMRAQRWSVRWLAQDADGFDPDHPFAFVSSAQSLSAKILDAMESVFVQPTGLPERIAPDIYWLVAGDGGWLEVHELPRGVSGQAAVRPAGCR